MTTDVTCLYSVVRNISGNRMFFSFLGSHGVDLDDNEEYSVFGNLADGVSLGNYGDRGGTHWRDALLSALGGVDDVEPQLEIVSTPNPILFDSTDVLSKMLVLDDGVLSAFDPCWASELA